MYFSNILFSNFFPYYFIKYIVGPWLNFWNLTNFMDFLLYASLQFIQNLQLSLCPLYPPVEVNQS